MTRKKTPGKGNGTKTWKFLIEEPGYNGPVQRWIEMKGRSQESARNKVSEVAGDRAWQILEIHEVKP